MRPIIIKNISASTKTWCNKEYTAGESFTLETEDQAENYAGNGTFITALAASEAQVGNGSVWMGSLAAAIAWLAGHTVVVSSTPPFSEPTHRTKLDAVASAVTIQPGESGNIDYEMAAERWAFGGEGLVLEAQPGDWIEAMVVDANSVIPEAYRAALCEASPGWPVVNTYLKKHWLLVPGGGQNTTFKINTYPLIAKITQGLVLRTIYHATSAGNARTVYANMFLTIKL